MSTARSSSPNFAGDLNLREDLAVLGAELRARINPAALLRWAEASPAPPFDSSTLRAVAATLSVLALATFIYSLLRVEFWPLISVLIVESLIFGWLHRRAEHTVAEVAANADGLILFSQLLERIGGEKFASVRLQQFVAALTGDHASAPQALRKLARIVFWIDARESVIGRFLDVTVLYTIQCAFAAEAWRRAYGSKIRDWLAIAGEMEALLSLAAYSFEHPADPFPEFTSLKASRLWFMARSSAIRSFLPQNACVILSSWTATRACFSSADPTCPAKAPTCAPSASTSF